MDPELSILADGLDHPEGVAWSPHGHLVCGGEHGQIISVDPQTGVWHQIADTEGWPLGMAFDASDRLYVCDYGTHAVVRVELGSGYVDDITTGFYSGRMRSPNYPVFATDGTLYFSDSGNWNERDALILARTPDGQVTVATDDARGFANGLAIDPAGECLYVVESSVPGISKFKLLGNGRLGKREIVLDLPKTVPDGLAFTAEGAIVVACFRPDGLYLWDGTSLEMLAHDWSGRTLSAPTNVAFFGTKLDRLVTANLASYHLTEVHAGLIGAPLNFPVLD